MTDVRLRIDHVVLEGVAFAPAQAAAFRAALQRELIGLLRGGGLAAEQQGGAVPRMTAPAVALPPAPAPAVLARSVAHSIYRSLVPHAEPRRP